MAYGAGVRAVPAAEFLYGNLLQPERNVFMRILRGALILVCVLSLTCVLIILLVPERWVADRIEAAAGAFLDADLQIDTLSLNRLSMHPSVQFSDVTLTGPRDDELLDIGRFHVSIDIVKLITGNVVFDKIELVDSTAALAVDEEGGANWEFLLDAFPPGGTEAEAEVQESTQDSQPVSIPVIKALSVENFNVTLDDRNANRSADVTISASGSTLSMDEPALIMVDGIINSESVALEAELTALAPVAIPPENLKLDVKAELGGSTVSAAGTLMELTTLGDIDLEFAVQANGLQQLENVVGIGLPEFPAFDIKGSVIREDNFIVLRRFDGNLVNTALEGDVRVDYTTTPITVFANVISSVTDLDDLEGLIGGTPDTATADNTESNTQQNEPDRGRLLPNGPIDLLPLTRFFNGTIEYRAESVESERLPISSFDLKAEVEGLKLSISPASVDMADGNVSGSANFDVANESPEGVFELEVNRVNLRELMKSIGIDDDSFGVIGGRAKFWVSGNTVSEMASNLDGGIFLLMTEAQLDSLLSEIAGLDVVESITLLLDPDKALTEVRCAYLDMHAASGVVNIANLVIDADDTVFLADGSVDLNDESLDVTIEPHPKDLSVLAARTAVQLGGSFSEPSLTTGRSLPARAVAAAALAALGTPILAVIPFIEAGTGEDSTYCSGLIDSLGEAEAEAE